MKSKAEENIFAFRPENRKDSVERYRASINLKGSLTDLKALTASGALTCTSSFDDYEKNRVKSIDDIKPAEGVATPMLDRLKAATSTASARAKAAIAANLGAEPDPAPREKYNKDLGSVNQIIAENKSDEFPSSHAEYLLVRKSEVIGVINPDHDLRKTNINDAFAQNEDIAELKNEGWSDADLDALNKELIGAMDRNHDEESKKFEQAIETSANHLFNAEANERRRVGYASEALERYRRESYIYFRSRKVGAEIEAMMQGETAIMVGGGSDASLKYVDLKKLTTSESVAGDDAQKQDGKIHFTTSRIWESDDSIRMRAGSSVDQLLSSGEEYITLTITNKDPKEAARVAKLAMEGAVAAGADPMKVTLLVNGEQKWKYDEKGELKDELFKDEPERKKFADFKKTDLAERQEKIIKGTPEQKAEKVRQMKEKIQAMQEPRVADEEQEQVQQQPIQP